MFVPLLKIHVFLGNDYVVIIDCIIFCQANMRWHNHSHSACCGFAEGLVFCQNIFIFISNIYYFILGNI